MSYTKQWFIFFLILSFGCAPPKPSGPQEADIAENNKAVGLMGYFDYQGAHDIFKVLSEAHPDWRDVSINLAIATLNLQTEGSEDKALAILAGVLDQEPNNLRAHYCSALLYLYKGDTATAKTHFQTVADGDPDDAHAAYYLGQCHARDGDHEAAQKWYKKAIDKDPYLRSAYYGLFQSKQRMGDRDGARMALEDFQKLDGNPQAHQAEFKYRRMGPKAEAATTNLQNPSPVSMPEGPLFAESKMLADLPEGAAWTGFKQGQPSITTCDLNGDDASDLFIPKALTLNNKILNGIFLATEDGFTLDVTHPLATIENVNTALWGDMNNDGLWEVYLCRSGENLLLSQEENGVWTNLTSRAEVGNGNLNTVDGLWLDADHDGDLDLFLVNDNGPNELYNNNLDGTFRPLAKAQGLEGDGQGVQVVATDLDNDRDVDLLVFNQSSPHEAYLNDRLWQYRPAEGFDDLLNSPVSAAAAGDLDGDGQVELYVLNDTGQPAKWQPAANGAWEGQNIGSVTGSQIGIYDFNGDGNLEFFLSASNGWRILDGENLLHDQKSQSVVAYPIVLSQQAANGPSVVEVVENGEIHLFQPGPGRHSFAAFRFSGKEDKGASMRSNILGIGTRYAARNGSKWTTGSTFPSHSGPGQGSEYSLVGMNGAAALDYLAVYWSDGVFQTELSQKAGLRKITETQRQLSSCPVLFVWDGDKYRFVSDLLGVGGMGYAVGPGQYSTPRPWENFQLPQNLLKPQNNQYKIMIAEPMEESCYLDSVTMAVYDLPPGWKMTLDERMGTGHPQPTGEPRYYREEILPIWAGNERGETVTNTIMEQDFKAAPIPAVDQRFIGILSSEHLLTLKFDQSLDRGSPMLILDGWVEYPYSQTNFAAWQAGVACKPPTLEARSGDGDWTVVYDQFGYPAGMPRRMSVPLENLPEGADQLRLRTNQEIYWDRASVAWSEPCPDARKQLVPPHHAVLQATGFALRTTGDQRLPQYDATRTSPLWDTRHQRGFYTELGEMTPLVSGTDDALAIFGPGEAITLTYNMPKQAALEGWTRVEVLETAGWCKDMDLYTRDGETLSPLPESGKPPKQRAELHKQYNTRFKSGY